MRAIIFTSAIVLVMILGSCSTSRVAGPGVYYDDIYYVPGVSRENVNDAFSPVPSLTREQEKEESRALAAQQNVYNRSERAYAQQDMRDFSGVQDEYATILSDGNIQDTDTLLYYNDETGYWVDGFQGSSMDRDYAERLVRFHSPSVRIPYYSPFYSEVVYYNHYDWNVYVDGNYAYAFPTWTNRWYDYHYYNRRYRPYSNFHFGWSYGYPYYGGGYYGYGWNHYSPYYGYNNWYNPYYYGYNSYHNHNHYYGGSGYYNRPGSQQAVNRGMRQGLNSDRSMATSDNTRNGSTLKTGTDQPRSNTSQRGQVSTRNTSNTATAQNSERAVRGTVSRPQGETKSTGTSTTTTTGRQATRDNYSEGTPTRRSYTPTYSQTEGNTRPVYNRATYTRVSNSPRPAQSTGTVQPGTTNTRAAQTTGSTRSVQTSSPTQNRQVAPSSTQTRPTTPATQSTRPVPQRSTTTQPSTGSTTRPAATRPSAPATYQRGSSTAPARTSTPNSSSPSRSYSTPAPTRSSSSSSYSAPSSSSSYSSGSSSSSGNSSGSPSRSNSSGRSSGGRR